MVDQSKDSEEPGDADATLEALFAQARAIPPEMPVGLSNRIVMDAQQIQISRSQASVEMGPPEAGPGLWAQLRATLGGWPALGGMVVASLLGVWIGAAPPAFLPDATQTLGQTAQDVDVFDSFDMAIVFAEDGS